VQLRQEEVDLATPGNDGETVEPGVTDLHTKRRSKEIAAQEPKKSPSRVGRRSWYGRRARIPTAPTAKGHQRRVFAFTLLAGACGLVAVVLLAAQVSGSGA